VPGIRQFDRLGIRAVRALAADATYARVVRWPTRVKAPLWTRFEWPPLEWFTGPIDVAHGAFHLLPPSRRAKRTVTVFDLTCIRLPEVHRPGVARMHRAMLEHAVRNADALVAISEHCRKDLIDLLNAVPENVHVAHGGVTRDEFCGEFDEKGFIDLKARLGIGREYFVHLGTLEPRKNLPRLLEAYARVRSTFKEVPQLVLAGKQGWLCKPVFEAIETHRLADDVLLTGYLDRDATVLLLRGAQACLYPSLHEGFGLPVLEAMAARTPVLTSNVSAMPEVVGNTGLLVDPESVDAIEAGITDLVEHPDAAATRTEAAFERAGQFSWDNSAREPGRGRPVISRGALGRARAPTKSH